jgi:beta-glucosidase
MLGSWAPTGEAADAVTVAEGIEALLGADRVVRPRDPSVAAAAAAAHSADALLLCLGEDWNMSGEARSRCSLDLAADQQAMAESIVATGKPTIVLLFTGRPLSIGWLSEHAGAILLAWYPGVEAGHAIADVLFGAFSPSGRLPVTFPRSVGQIPLYYNHEPTGRPADPNNKYTSKYLDEPVTPLYPFGFGLTYSRIAYCEIRLGAREIARGDSLPVTIEVANEGAFPVQEVVQLYLRDDVASVTRPVKMLRRFDRVPLAPGERRQVRFTLGPEDFSFVGLDLKPRIEPGTFTLFAGGSSEAALEARVVLRA